MSDTEEQQIIEDSQDEVIELPLKNETKSKPKRIMSEKQAENLKKARELAYAKRRELAEISKKEKELKKEQHLIRKLELEKKITNHENYKRQLLIDSGLAPKPVRSYKKKEEVIEEEDQEEQDEIIKLEEKLAKLKSKKKKVVIEESEEEIEEEEEIPKLTHKQVKKPIMNPEDKTRTKFKTPDIRNKEFALHSPQRIKETKIHKPLATTNDPQIIQNLKQLFPNFEF